MILAHSRPDPFAGGVWLWCRRGCGAVLCDCGGGEGGVVMSAVLSFVCVGDRRGECPITGSIML